MSTSKLLLLCGLFVISFAVQAESVGSAFTYQGELKQQDTPATGTYDFEFGLFDAESDGNSVATVVQIENVVVSNGVFTVELDFGESSFTGDQRWLELSVRDGASVGPHVVLSPRQVITPTPYAVRALKVFDRVVVVSGARSAVENGSALVEAVTFIQAQGPSEVNPWLIQLEPGLFDLGDQMISLPDHLSLKGSGHQETRILSTSVLTLELCSFCSIGDLEIRSQHSDGSSTGVAGVGIKELHLKNIRVDHESTQSGSYHRAFGLVATGNVLIENSEFVGRKLNSAGYIRGMTIRSIGDATISMQHVKSFAEGTGDTHVVALSIDLGANLNITDVYLDAKSNLGKAFGLRSLNAALVGTLNRLTVNVKSGFQAWGAFIDNAHSLEIQQADISGEAPLLRLFALDNENVDLVVNDIKIADSHFEGTGNDVIGIVFRPNQAPHIGLKVDRTEVLVTCVLSGFCFSMFAINTSDELSRLTINQSSFTSNSNAVTDIAQGIRLESINAQLNMVRSDAFQFPLVVDWNAPAVSSMVTFSNGILSSNYQYLAVKGAANVSIFNSTILSGVVSHQGSSTVTCAGNVIRSVFLPSGC